MTLDQKRASFAISYAMAMIHALKHNTKPKTARWNRLAATEESLGKSLDFYRIEHFHRRDLDAASRLFDFIDQELHRIVPDDRRKRQVRRHWRHNRLAVSVEPRRAHR